MPSVGHASRTRASQQQPFNRRTVRIYKNKLHQTLIFLDFGCFYEFLAFTDQRLRVSNSSQTSAQKQDFSFIYLLYFSVQLKSTYISQTCFFINLNASITAVILFGEHFILSLKPFPRSVCVILFFMENSYSKLSVLYCCIVKLLQPLQP